MRQEEIDHLLLASVLENKQADFAVKGSDVPESSLGVVRRRGDQRSAHTAQHCRAPLRIAAQGRLQHGAPSTTELGLQLCHGTVLLGGAPHEAICNAPRSGAAAPGPPAGSPTPRARPWAPPRRPRRRQTRAAARRGERAPRRAAAHGGTGCRPGAGRSGGWPAAAAARSRTPARRRGLLGCSYFVSIVLPARVRAVHHHHHHKIY